MSSMLTNNGAMVALQTLKSINSNLGTVQNQISTGKNIANAKDNSAIWAISKVMESDVQGFKGITDSLNLGESTVAVARSAAETVTDLLTQMKGKIVAAQESNVDRVKIQADITALRDQIGSVTGAAQFNGLSLLDLENVTPAGTSATNTIAEQIKNSNSGTVNILSSLDRSGSGVASSSIGITKQSLSQTAQVAGTVVASATTINTTAAASSTATLAAPAGSTVTFAINGDVTNTLRGGARVLAGDTYTFAATGFDKLSVAAGTDITAAVSYVAKAGDTTEDIAKGMASQINVALTKAGYGDDYAASYSNDGDSTATLTITNNSGVAGAAAFAATDFVVTSGGTSGGGLDQMADLDVSTEDSAKAALIVIEDLIQTSIDSAAAFGSAQGRIETQSEFVSSLTDSLKSGIGSLVDADMEEASARLQALQVQQQLGVQALSIANQAPQQLLSLFR
ncbi:flagellin [Puniceibacterium sp. IMCC21224]|uniref:flagellin N-terminal helical domain-containing protein n=1 Tax=Puniceibacterium sp. IMCC21224 TaxID=1618204 RepID=UPI00064DFAD7|nr:flagellin [Puniceibacterium sp. IMCC21224]KMK65887.1 flagellin/flagellar hook associated protein [Puniceibacterium sp. IMCC21224]